MRITIAGDFTTEGRGMKSVLNNTAISDDILSILHNSDYNIINLESPVVNACCKKITKSGPHLFTSPITVSYLKRCGFNAVTLANNHFYDYGLCGVNTTIEQLEKHGIDFVGGGREKEELRKILFVNKDNTKIAIVNCCEHEFSVNEEAGSNALNEIDLFYIIQNVKKSVDVVILIVHGGSEGYQLPSPRMHKLYRFFIDIGANVVVNHHQHCYSGYEVYHEGFIFYGLGNFFFDDVNECNTSWNKGFFVTLDIVNRKIMNVDFYPYEQCLNDKVDVHLMTGEKKNAFFKTFDILNSIIIDEKKLDSNFRSFCQSKANNYYYSFSPYSNKYLLFLCKRGLLPAFISKSKRLKLLNYIECESHRDIVIYALKR